MDSDDEKELEELKAIRCKIARYMELRDLISPLEKEKSSLSDFLKAHIAENGDIETDIGTATTRRVQKITFSGKEVNNLCESWSKSKNPDIRSCADMLKPYRTITNSTQLEVK
jgi:hypothetical protein